MELQTNTFDPVHLSGALAMSATFIYVLSQYGTTYPIELVILSVAAVAYFLLSSLPKSLWLRIRYVDWFVTVPLLVYVISQYGSLPYWVSGALSLAMLAAGFIAVVNNKVSYNWFIVYGFAFYIGFMISIWLANNSLPWWIYIFLFTWALYGFVDRLEGPKDHWAYTLLDIINKPVFIILLLNHIA